MVKTRITKAFKWGTLLLFVVLFAKCIRFVILILNPPLPDICSSVVENSNTFVIEPLLINLLIRRDSINNKNTIDRGRLPNKSSYYLVSNFDYTKKQIAVLDSFACANRPNRKDMDTYRNISIAFFHKTAITNNDCLNELPGFFDDYTEPYDYIYHYYWGTTRSCAKNEEYHGKAKNKYTRLKMWFIKLMDRLSMRGGSTEVVAVSFKCS